MEKVTRNITVDLSRKSNARVVFATQNDLKSRRLSIRLTDDGKPYPVNRDVTATVNFLCEDGTSGAYLGTVCADGSVEYVVDAAILLIAGQTKCSVSLIGDDGARLTSSPFIIDVFETLYAGSDISPEAAESLIDSMMKAHATMQKAEIQRETQEDLRTLSELEREDRENGRIEAEGKRAEAEIKRAEAEDKRAEAEGQRQEYYENVDTYLRGIEDVQNGYISELSDSVALVELKRVYPVGSVYTSVNETSPALLFGGTWERLKDRFLLSAGDTYAAGSVGGNKTHTHSIDGLWAEIYANREAADLRGKGIMMLQAKAHEGLWTKMDYFVQDNRTLIREDSTVNTDRTQYGTAIGGSLGSTNNLPPYLAVYMWRRVA